MCFANNTLLKVNLSQTANILAYIILTILLNVVSEVVLGYAKAIDFISLFSMISSV